MRLRECKFRVWCDGHWLIFWYPTSPPLPPNRTWGRRQPLRGGLSYQYGVRRVLLTTKIQQHIATSALTLVELCCWLGLPLESAGRVSERRRSGNKYLVRS